MFPRSLMTLMRIIAVYVVVVVIPKTEALDRLSGDFARPRPDGGFLGNGASSLSPSPRTTNALHRQSPLADQRHDDSSSPPFLRSYMSAAVADVNGRQQSIHGMSPPARPIPPPPPSGRDENGPDEASNDGLSSSSSPSWRWCYICSGKYPDRECELYPKRVTRGPAKTNCTKGYCTSYVRYKPKPQLIVEDDNKKPVAVRPLEPDDFDVTSIARECESFGRGNTCILDGDQLGVTCYSSCTTDFCNDDTRRPGWEHFRHSRFHQDRQRPQSEGDGGDDTKPTASSRDQIDERREIDEGRERRDEQSPRRGGGDDAPAAGGTRPVESQFGSVVVDENTRQHQPEQRIDQRIDVVSRSLPENNEIVRGPFARDAGRPEPPSRMHDNGLPDYTQMERDSENIAGGPPPHHHRVAPEGTTNGGHNTGSDVEVNRTSSSPRNSAADGATASSSETAKSKSGKNQLGSSAANSVQAASPCLGALAMFYATVVYAARNQ